MPILTVIRNGLIAATATGGMLGLGITGYLAIRSSDPNANQIEPSFPAQHKMLRANIGAVALKSKTNFAVDLENPSSGPIKIVGFEALCKRQGCVVAEDLPSLIPAHKTGRLRFLYQADEAGPFDLTTTILLESGGGMGYSLPIEFAGLVLDGASADIPSTPQAFPHDPSPDSGF